MGTSIGAAKESDAATNARLGCYKESIGAVLANFRALQTFFQNRISTTRPGLAVPLTIFPESANTRTV